VWWADDDCLSSLFTSGPFLHETDYTVKSNGPVHIQRQIHNVTLSCMSLNNIFSVLSLSARACVVSLNVNQASQMSSEFNFGPYPSGM
jgi:hypothetical protein